MLPISRDFHENVIGPRFEINFCIGGPRNKAVVNTSYNVVVFSLPLKAELQDEVIFADEALKIARVQLFSC